MNDLVEILEKIARASIDDPGKSDLDNEQPVVARINLGDVRYARHMLWRLEHGFVLVWKEGHGN